MVCRETDEDCAGRKKTYIVTHPIGVGYAVGGAAIERIPAQQLWVEPWRRYGEGLNVHAVANSKGTFDSEGHFVVFKPGDFAFAITRKVAEEFLPKTLTFIDILAERRKEAS